ncbi:GDSL-type esterase/lipase family protein [Arenibaculum sp.]|uniref:SGNH/GDSL hydrolase family protein n=1 Tax=Arenibaculum sp. TaxID=2865862 RepID=UPI002E16760F|nr:GDSL-type esterase/lipase family protein [Arenibaculum sp.]
MSRKPLTHEDAVLEVYRLTPQIREYDEFMYLGVRWLPYTMFFHHKNYRSAVINTDALGFRYSDCRGTPVSVADMPEGKAINLLVGGSTTLGTGATTDAGTVASRLAAHTGEPWLNLGGRGYNAVQEVLLYLMHQHRFGRINNVVVFSGINTLTLEGLPDNLASDHGRYYYSFEYQHYMEKYNEDLKRRSRTYASELDNRSKGFFSRYLDKLRAEENPADVVITDEETDTGERVRRAAWTITNALRQWQQLLAGTGARLTFVLQPMSYWTRGHLTPEEADVFHAIDSCPNNFWRLFSKILGEEIHRPFSDAIASSCEARSIRFADMNDLMKDSPILNEYLFVDRVHFNDKGYDEAARLIAARVL